MPSGVGPPLSSTDAVGALVLEALAVATLLVGDPPALFTIPGRPKISEPALRITTAHSAASAGTAPARRRRRIRVVGRSRSSSPGVAGASATESAWS
jgi:hypothetical protein